MAHPYYRTLPTPRNSAMARTRFAVTCVTNTPNSFHLVNSSEFPDFDADAGAAKPQPS